jgi:hypothetical protein
MRERLGARFPAMKNAPLLKAASASTKTVATAISVGRTLDRRRMAGGEARARIQARAGGGRISGRADSGNADREPRFSFASKGTCRNGRFISGGLWRGARAATMKYEGLSVSAGPGAFSARATRQNETGTASW